MNGKILTSLLLIGLVIGVVGGATLAAFYDTETSASNTFTASSLDLTVDGRDDPYIVNFNFSSLTPGRYGIMNWTLRNIGKTNGTLDILITADDDPGINTEPEGITDFGELSESTFVILSLIKNGVPQIVDTGTLNATAEFHNIDYALDSGESTEFVIEWYIQTVAGNEIQGDEVTVDITFMLNQTV